LMEKDMGKGFIPPHCATIRRMYPIRPIQSHLISQHNQRKDTP